MNNPTPTPTQPPITIQQKITQNGCGAGCGKGCLILIALILGFLAITIHSCSSNSRQQREKSTTTTSTAPDQHHPKNAVEHFLATNEPARKLKQSIDEAKKSIPAQLDDPALVEARKAKATRAYSKPLPDIREEIAKRTREHAEEKLNPKRLTLLDLQRRTHKLGTVWIQRFNADGKKWRTGFLESGGILSQIAPKTLQTYIDESTPED